MINKLCHVFIFLNLLSRHYSLPNELLDFLSISLNAFLNRTMTWRLEFFQAQWLRLLIFKWPLWRCYFSFWLHSILDDIVKWPKTGGMKHGPMSTQSSVMLTYCQFISLPISLGEGVFISYTAKWERKKIFLFFYRTT